MAIQQSSKIEFKYGVTNAVATLFDIPNLQLGIPLLDDFQKVHI
jgi:hypothetical protein